MDHTKANFRATRELLGISQQMMADMLDVDIRSVKRWESPKVVGYRAPADAWALLEDYRKKQEWVIQKTLENLEKVEDKMGGKPQTVSLSYWASADSYDAAHPGEGKYWKMANANSRAIAANLDPDIYDIEFDYGISIKREKAVIYASREKTDDQVAACREFAKESGYEIVDTYIETDGSQLKRLINDAGFKDFRAVIVTDLSRISKSRDKISSVKDALRDSGIPIRCARH